MYVCIIRNNINYANSPASQILVRNSFRSSNDNTLLHSSPLTLLHSSPSTPLRQRRKEKLPLTTLRKAAEAHRIVTRGTERLKEKQLYRDKFTSNPLFICILCSTAVDPARKSTLENHPINFFLD